jgi:hypothetical protein
VYVTQAAEVEVSKERAVRLRRVVHCGTVVNLDTMHATDDKGGLRSRQSCSVTSARSNETLR